MHLEVLIYGHDSILLRTRELLLERAGFEVCVTEAPGQMHAILAARPIDLLILCHTVGIEERSKILAAARASQKNLTILFLVATSQTVAIAENDAVFSTLDGPDGFLQTVCRLTHRPPPSPFVSNSSNTGQKLCRDSQAQ